MLTNPVDVVGAFAGLRVLVVGDGLLDSYLEGGELRFCREAPVPNVSITARVDRPGGAANTAANLCTLGAATDYLSVVGDDDEGHRLTALLRERKVGLAPLVRAHGRRTRTKHRILADRQLLLSFDSGDTMATDAESEHHVLRELRARFHDYDAVVVADYGYGLLSGRAIDTIAALQRPRAQRLIVDSRHRLAAFRDARPTAVKPNYQEALEILGEPAPHAGLSRWDVMDDRRRDLLDATGAALVAVTLDRDGALLMDASGGERIYGMPVQARGSAGAGDTFIATFTLALAAQATPRLAAELAVAAAAVAVSDEHTATCSSAQLLASLAPGNKRATLAALRQCVQLYRQQGRRIVLTNGCFDILHSGHVALLAQAKACGDVLIVGVNSDASIRRLKGAGRPVCTLDDRIGVLSALSCVDHVVAFEDDTCGALVEALCPDVYVKGGDYTRQTLPEAALVERLGGVIRFIPHARPQSTASLIRRIREQSDLSLPGQPVSGPSAASARAV